MWRDRSFFLLHDNIPMYSVILRCITLNFWLKKWFLYSVTRRTRYFGLLNYFLFPKLKMDLKGDHFTSIDEIQKAMTTKLISISKIKLLKAWKGWEIVPTYVLLLMKAISSKKCVLTMFCNLFSSSIKTVSKRMGHTMCINIYDRAIKCLMPVG